MTVGMQTLEPAILQDYLPAETPGVSHDQQVDPTTSKIMVLDDVLLNIKLVCAYLASEGYEQFVKLDDPTQAISTIYREEPDVLLLDLMMPAISGIDILRAIRTDQRFAHLPVLILTASDNHELKRQALEAGATDFLTKPVDADDLIPRVRNALMAKRYQDSLERQVRKRTHELEASREEVVLCLARAAEHRDEDTGNHVIRVGQYVGIIARGLGMDNEKARMLELAAILHDAGKIGISDTILLKPDKLSNQEFDLMKKHCDFGHSICEPTTTKDSHAALPPSEPQVSILGTATSPLLKLAASVAWTHHEKWDGNGYPQGISGEDIPIEGRITAVADVFDALNNERPYKPAFPLEKCYAILEEGRGTHFDPQVLDAFLASKESIVRVLEKYADE